MQRADHPPGTGAHVHHRGRQPGGQRVQQQRRLPARGQHDALPGRRRDHPGRAVHGDVDGHRSGAGRVGEQQPPAPSGQGAAADQPEVGPRGAAPGGDQTADVAGGGDGGLERRDLGKGRSRGDRRGDRHREDGGSGAVQCPLGDAGLADPRAAQPAGQASPGRERAQQRGGLRRSAGLVRGEQRSQADHAAGSQRGGPGRCQQRLRPRADRRGETTMDRDGRSRRSRAGASAGRRHHPGLPGDGDRRGHHREQDDQAPSHGRTTSVPADGGPEPAETPAGATCPAEAPPADASLTATSPAGT